MSLSSDFTQTGVGSAPPPPLIGALLRVPWETVRDRMLTGLHDRGFNDLSTTLQAQQNWRVIRAQLTSAQVQALRRSVQAMKALGGGWPVQAYAAQTRTAK